MREALTNQEYETYQKAYDLFNARLFDGMLNDVLITLQRKPNTFGYFSKGAFNAVGDSKGERAIDEIAVNPDIHAQLPPIEVWQTLVHEMCHKWQHDFGIPSRRTYHNQEWASKMNSIGLTPSSTGKPGGNMTGQKMADYPAEGGKFNQAVIELDQKGIALSTQSYVPLLIETVVETMSDEIINEHIEEGYTETEALKIAYAVGKRSKLKYECPECKLAVWGKPKIHVICGDCEKHLVIAI